MVHRKKINPQKLVPNIVLWSKNFLGPLFLIFETNIKIWDLFCILILTYFNNFVGPIKQKCFLNFWYFKFKMLKKPLKVEFIFFILILEFFFIAS